MIIQELLQESRKNIEYFFDSVNVHRLQSIVETCFACKGLLAITGVGKSGIIAEKIAATLASTGSKAIYLPALNFLHGDIGILSEGDIVLMLSKSGEADELLTLIPHIRKKKSIVIALTAHPESRLAKQADDHFHLPMQKELCQFDLVPTTSAELQLIFGDILAVTLMRMRNFQLVDYAQNHPSGSIGKKMTLLVDDLMVRDEGLPICSANCRLGDKLVELTEKKCGALIITDDNDILQGIFTDGDLRRALQTYGSSVLEKRIGDLMTKQTISVPSQTLAWEALRKMQTDPNKRVSVSPVVKENKVIGLLRMLDIVQAGLT